MKSARERVLIIANPAARSGGAARAIPRLREELGRLNIDYALEVTGGPDHAIEIAARGADQGFDVVAAAGGDGTVNEVLNGLMQASVTGRRPPALGVLGIGRGNDFGHSMGVPGPMAAACAALASDQRRTIDVGRVVGGKYAEGRYFGNCVGVGFDAIGTIEANRLPRMGGFVTYLVAVLKTIFLYYRAPLTRISVDDWSVTQPAILVSVMNGRRLGGGFQMAPESRPDDGQFDLCIGGAPTRARMFALLPHFVRGTQASQEEVTTARGSKVTITALEGSLPAQMDGEILCTDGAELEIEILPRQIEVVVAAGESRA